MSRSVIQEIREKSFTIIGRQTKIQGEISFEGSVRIAGRFDGHIRCMNGDLIIERHGHVTGTIDADQIQIEGTFAGTIDSAQHVLLLGSAVVEGKIRAQKLIVHPGALVNIEGQCGAV